MTFKRQLVVIGAVTALTVATAAVLTFAVEPEEIVEDRPRDLKLSLSHRRPAEKSLADVRFAQVREAGEKLVFEVVLSQDVPPALPGGYFDVYWDLYGESDWRLTVALAGRLEATLISKATRSGTTTFDGTFPGTVTAEGDAITVEIDRALTALPPKFRWKLTTRLNMRQSDPLVGVIYDYAPEGRFGNFHL